MSSSEQLCYVHCEICDTVLAVSVPCSSLSKTVTVRCGHCSNLHSINMRGLPLPAANQHNLMDEIPCPPSSLLLDQPNLFNTNLMAPVKGAEEELSQPPVVNRPPEKHQRVPSACNRFIKDEIQPIKAGNPNITHTETFSAAAKNEEEDVS